ncbi:MAG: DUF973 family protein [Thermoprotei archaeon]
MSQPSLNFYALFEKMKDASLWTFISLILALLGTSLHSFGFIIAVVGLYFFITYAAPKLKSALSDLYTYGVVREDRSKWVDTLKLSLIALLVASFIAFLAFLSALLFLGFLAILLGGLSTVVYVLGVLGVLVSSIFIGLSIYEAGEYFKDNVLSISGILVVIPYVNILGWILVYLEANNLAFKYATPLPPAPQQGSSGPPSPPPGPAKVFAEGSATIRSNGQVTVILVANAQLSIVNVALSGFQTSLVTVSPQTLQVGRNLVVAYLRNLPQLQPNVGYALVITFSDGSSISVPAYYAP